jgi:hypothetical protein
MLKRKAMGHGQSTRDCLYGTPTSGPLARTENFVERLTTLSTWLMGYTAQYLGHWETASSRKSHTKSSNQSLWLIISNEIKKWKK